MPDSDHALGQNLVDVRNEERRAYNAGPETIPWPKDAPRPDPPVPPNGKCVVCGKARNPKRSRAYAGGQAELDPFCSSSPCCRTWHDNPLPKGKVTAT